MYDEYMDPSEWTKIDDLSDLSKKLDIEVDDITWSDIDDNFSHDDFR